MKQRVWSVIGAGNGGQAMAGHLAIAGNRVRLYDIFPDKIEAIRRSGGIQVDGEVSGFGRLELATTSMEEAVRGVDVINVVTPANAHREIAQKAAPFLEDGQIVILHPGSSFGCLEFNSVLKAQGCRARVTLGETYTLMYAARSSAPGQASILGLKKSMGLATFPASEVGSVLDVLREPFPFLVAEANVLCTTLKNVNPIVHPIPYLLNLSRIDNQEDFLFYYDGYSPAIGEFVEREDGERVRLGRALGLELPSMTDIYRLMYRGIRGRSLYEVVSSNPAYANIGGAKAVRTRYLLEDIPFGLVPWLSLGEHLGVDLPIMRAVLSFTEQLLQEDLRKEARTVESVGLGGMSADEMRCFVETGGG